ncbi:MAG: hypothetical protein QOH21_101 [Acidobacteriota bacterium]|jgi:arylsulfatase A-like enzyme|nr:hypothetical protein [Acidobacteriota bacterium]
MRRPNVLVLMVDELRYPTVYDSKELKKWMEEKLVAQRMLRKNGIEFERHYTMSSACAPSRTSIFTGEYPSLHGVTQTDGAAKSAWDPGMYWLDPNTVPTLGDWFKAAGYRTFYKGKWHISHADILMPGSHDSLASTRSDGTQIERNVDYYAEANRLKEFGFDGWIGPEPHGRSQANSGWVRDKWFCKQAVDLLDALDESEDDTPWLLVNSYVNPHDIVFFGLMWQSFGYPFTDPSIPNIPPPPTATEDLSTKPICQASYIDVYPKMLLPQPTVELYRQFYYYLQQTVDQYLVQVYERLMKSRFARDTIIVFTSDHGDMLGAHGGMHQKWYQAYEETIHVPLIVAGEPIPKTPRKITTLTSHADLAPTLLGLANVDIDAARQQLERDHTETRRLVGRDLSAAILKGEAIEPEPVYFMTSDDVSRGLNELTARKPYAPVVQPNNVETVVVDLDGVTWKYSRYFEPPDADGTDDKNPRPMYAEWELYNLTADPLETTNLAYAGNTTPLSETIRPQLQEILRQQRLTKRLLPKGERVTRAGGEGM